MDFAQSLGGVVIAISASIMIDAGATSAEANCAASPAGIVICAQNTMADGTIDTDGAVPNSNSRTQLFDNGNPIAAEIKSGVTIGGAGFALVEKGKLERAQTLAVENNGSVAANEPRQVGLLLSGNGGFLSYVGSGTVTNATGPAIFARNSGDITLTVDGAVEGGAPGVATSGLTPTPAGIEADGYGDGNVVIGGTGDVAAPGGRGIIAEEAKNGQGSVLVTGTGDVAGEGRICPGVDYSRGLKVGKVGCSGIRAVIESRTDPSDVTVNRSGDVSGTSTAVNAITRGKGNIAVITGQNANLVGVFEFGIEAMGQGRLSTGSIAVTTGSGSTISSGGDGIFASNLAAQIPVGAKSTIDIHSAGQITSGTFPEAAHNDKNPTGVLAGISAGYVGGVPTQPNPSVNGSVFVDNTALITAHIGDGILGYNFGAGSVNVTTNSSISALGGDGVVTQATTGPTTIVVTGTRTSVEGSGSGDAALTSRSTGGNIDVQVGDGAILQGTDGAVGLEMEGTRSVKSISNFGTIIGGRSENGNPTMSPIDGVGVVGTNLTILNNGAIIGGSATGRETREAFAVSLTGGVNSIGGTGTIIGGADVSGTSSFMPALSGSIVGKPLSINGPLRFVSTATYDIRLTPAAADSTIATGAAILHGATVAVDLLGAAPDSGAHYTILNAEGGVADQFSGVTSGLAFFRPMLTYGATNVVLTSRYDYLLSDGTQNQMAVGAALNTAAAQTRTGGSSAIFDTLQNLTTLEGPVALDALSGEGITATQSLAYRSAQLFNSAIFDQTTFFGPGSPGNNVILTAPQPGFTTYVPQADASRAPIHELADLPNSAVAPLMPTFPPTRTWRAWGNGFGGVDDVHGNSTIGSTAQNNDIYGGAIGVDYQVTPSYLAGAAVGGSDGEFSGPGRGTSGSTTGGHIAFYDIATFGSFYGASSNSFSYFTNRTTRVTGGFGGLGSETDRGSFDSHEFRTRLEFGRHFDGYDGAITPFIALELADLRSNGFSESPVSGPGLLALNVNGQSSASVPSFVGARFQRLTALGSGMTFSPTLQVAYVHEFAPQRTEIGTLVDLPGSTFLVNGARPGRDAGQLKFGGELALNAHLFLFANFDGEFSGVDQFYGGHGGLTCVW